MPSRGRPTGRPVEFVNRRFIPQGGKRREYYDRVTGQYVSRTTYQKYLARVYGFHDVADYYAFSRMFPGGLGGLTGLSPRDVSRVRTILLDIERKQGLPAGTVLDNNFWLGEWARRFMEGETGHDKKVALNHFLDRAGIRAYTPTYLPGDTP